MKYYNITCADSINCITGFIRSLQDVCIRITTNGGKTWYSTLRDSSHRNQINEVLNIAYPDTNLCILAIDSGYYWRSTDKGQTWEKKRYRDTNYKIYESYIKFADKNHGLIAEPRNLFTTSDGGNTWRQNEVKIKDTTSWAYFDISMPSANSIIILAHRRDSNGYRANYIIRSDDFGNNWIFYPDIVPIIENISFVDSLNGWGVGGLNRQNKTSDLIRFTSDGGMSWITQLDSITSTTIHAYGLSKIKFVDKNSAVALGPWWHLWKTTDGGNKWLIDTSYHDRFYGGQLTDYFSDIAYPSKNQLFGVGKLDGKIYKFDDAVVSVIDEPNINDGILIYPNPLHNVSDINIVTNFIEPAVLRLAIYNSLGRLVDQSNEIDINPGRQELQYKFSEDLGTGVYIIRFLTDEGRQIIRPIIILK